MFNIQTYNEMNIDRKFNNKEYNSNINVYIKPNNHHVEIGKDTNIRIFDNEKHFLGWFVTYLYKYDPDIIVSHKLTNIIDNISMKLKSYNTNCSSKLSRLRMNIK